MQSSLVILSALLAISACTAQTLKPPTLSGKYPRLDKDVEAYEVLVDEFKWAQAKAIYSNGRFSKPRTMKKLSTSANSLMKGEVLFERYKKYYKSARYADKLVLSAINGNGALKGKLPIFRAEIALKTVQYWHYFMWVAHKLEVAAKRCSGRKAAALQALLEAVSDYRGSIIKANGSGEGQVLFTLAVKRCTQFGTCVSGGPVLRAKVNLQFDKLAVQMRSAISSGKCARALVLKNQLLALMHVAPVQGCMRYMEITKDAPDEEARQKAHAEGYAFCGAVLPSVDACDKKVARQIVKNFRPSTKNPMSDSVKSVNNALRSTLSCLGITCGQVGSSSGGLGC